MSEAEFCCDEGQWLADRDQYERERKANGDSLVQAMQKRIENQREEIRRLHNHAENQKKCIGNLTQSRNYWKTEAERWKAEADEKSNLEHILLGVMHSVDKWLEGDELEQDEVNRAATMREKTLRIVEELAKENEALRIKLF